jgi:hypothetical protein
MEPLTAGSLECLALGVPTSYKRVLALTCGDLFLGAFCFVCSVCLCVSVCVCVSDSFDVIYDPQTETKSTCVVGVPLDLGLGIRDGVVTRHTRPPLTHSSETGDDLSAPTGINLEALKPLAKGDDVSVSTVVG